MEPSSPERPSDSLTISEALVIDKNSVADLRSFLNREKLLFDRLSPNDSMYEARRNYYLGMHVGLNVARFNEARGSELGESGFIHFAKKGEDIVGYEVVTINASGVVNGEVIGVAWSHKGLNVARELLRARHGELKVRSITEYELGIPVGRYDGIKLMMETAGATVGEKIELSNGQQKCVVYLTEE